MRTLRCRENTSTESTENADSVLSVLDFPSPLGVPGGSKSADLSPQPAPEAAQHHVTHALDLLDAEPGGDAEVDRRADA
jgi:hypothetical protein